MMLFTGISTSSQSTMNCIVNLCCIISSCFISKYCRATTRLEHVEGDEEEEVVVDGEEGELAVDEEEVATDEEVVMDGEEEELVVDEEEEATEEGLAAEEGIPERKRPRLDSYD